MKRILHIFAFAVTLFAASSCVEPLTSVIPSQSQDLTISFSCGSMTKATVPGVNNEDVVKRIDFFVFPCGADGEVAAGTPYAYKGSITPTDTLIGTYRATISREYLADIFPNGADSAAVFAVANYVDYYGANNSWTPNTTLPAPQNGEKYVWGELDTMQVGATFFYDDHTTDFGLRWPHTLSPYVEKQNKDLFFVMTGKAKIGLVASGTGNSAVNGKVPLERLASKVTVSFNYVDYTVESLKTGNIYWVPQDTAGETRVYLSNAIEHTTLGGPLTRALVPDSKADQTKPNGSGKRDIFEYAYNFMNQVPKIDGKRTAHFYTYPISVEEGDDNQPYLKLVLPWYGYKYKGNDPDPVFDPETSPTSSDWEKCKQKEVYYKIVLPRETIGEPNRIYQYTVDVNIIGSDKEIMVPGYDYVVKDWLSGEAVTTNVNMARYLSLDLPKDYYDMYGDEVQILYVSSGEVEISGLQIYTQDLTGTAPVAEYFINGTPTSYVNPYNANTTDSGNPAVTLPNWVTIQGNQLVVHHTMNTNINSNQVDIAPFTFVVTLHLKGETDTKFDRTVTITQYPPIYAEIKLTADYHTVFLNGQQYTQNQVTVNNNATESLGTVGQNGGNTARTRTIVSVTTLANLDTTRYNQLGIRAPVIGDPRTRLGDKYPVNPGAAAQTWEQNDLGTNANNHIADYLYADVDKSNVIAPKFMLASGYGSCAGTKVDWIHNVERCASYQEDGYPAGRWRLPTEAEIVFVYNLAHDLGLLSNPFFTSSNYWANSGRRYYDGSFQAAGSGNYSSRCVYDLWYWGDDPVLDATTTPSITTWSGFMTSK